MKSSEPSKGEEEFKGPLDVLFELGLLIFADDSPDFPELIQTKRGITEPGTHGIFKGMQFPYLPPHPHHWIYGALIMLGSAAGKIWVALDSARRASELFGQESLSSECQP